MREFADQSADGRLVRPAGRRTTPSSEFRSQIKAKRFKKTEALAGQGTHARQHAGDGQAHHHGRRAARASSATRRRSSRSKRSSPISRPTRCTPSSATVLAKYRRTLQSDRRHLLDQFALVQVARKVVGVGSVGTRAWIRCDGAGDGEEPLFLQAKEAQPSVLADYCGRSQYANQGERVVAGQHLMQAESDIFLGWTRVHRARRRGPRLLRPPAAGLEVLGADRADAAARAWRSTPGCADGRWPGRTPAPGTGSRWPPTSAARTRSTTRSPSSPRRYADQNEHDYAALARRRATGPRRGHLRRLRIEGVASHGSEGLPGCRQRRHPRLRARLGAVRAAEGAGRAPNVVYIVLDDVGFSALGCYGGPIETPEHRPDRGRRCPLHAVAHHRAVFADPFVPADRPQPHAQHMACITEAAIGFPNASGTIPPENGMLSEILGEPGWNTYMVGKWHLCPTAEMNLAATRRNWPIGRGFERFYGFLGAETNQWYPDLVYDNHPVEQPTSPEEGYHLTEDITDKALEFIKDAKADRAGEAVLPVLRARRGARAASRAQGVDRQVRGPVRHGVRGDARADLARQKETRASSRPTPNCRRSTRSARPRPAPGPDGKPFPPLDYTKPWDSLDDDEKRLFARMAEVYAGFLAHADHHIGRLLDYLERLRPAREHPGHRGLGQRRQRRGRPERLGQRDQVLQRHPRRPGGEPRDARRTGRPEHLQPLPERVGDGVQHAVQDVEAVRVQRRHLRPVHHLLARRHEGARRDPRTSTTTPSTSCRRSWTRSASNRQRRSRATRRAGSTASACATASTTRRAVGARTTQFYSMLGSRAIWHDGWKAITTHPTISGWGHFNDDELGAVPHRHRPVRDARPRRRASRQAARAGQPLVRRGRRQPRVPARRPLRAGDHA